MILLLIAFSFLGMNRTPKGETFVSNAFSVTLAADQGRKYKCIHPFCNSHGFY